MGTAALGGWLVTEVLAGTAIARFDTAVVQWFVQWRTPGWTAPVDMVGRLGGTRVVVVLAVVAAALVLAGTRRWRPVLFLAVVLVGEVTLFLATASVIDRARPPVPHLGPHPASDLALPVRPRLRRDQPLRRPGTARAGPDTALVGVAPARRRGTGRGARRPGPPLLRRPLPHRRARERAARGALVARLPVPAAAPRPDPR